MAKVISIGNEKGGVGKTTTAAILSYLLSKEAKVLAIDFDYQGDLSMFLSQKGKKREFEGKTVYEACRDLDATPYIYKITDQLHLLPADDQLAMFHQIDNDLKYPPKSLPHTILSQAINSVRNDYDYIVIDLPPQAGMQVINGLHASDLAVCITLSDPLSYQKINNYRYLIDLAKQTNPSLVFAGLLVTSFDPRTGIDLAYLKAMEYHYSSILFKTVIKKRTKIKEFSHSGITDATVADRAALEQYQDFLKELLAIGEAK